MNPPKFFAAYPVLPCSSIPKAVAYYRDVLGFNAKTVSPDNSYAIVERDSVELHLDSPVYAREHTVGNAECYVWIKGDIDALHADFASRGALQLHRRGGSPLRNEGLFLLRSRRQPHHLRVRDPTRQLG